MKITKFIELVDHGFELEMRYGGKTYWVTWGRKDEKIFYEANKTDEIVFHKAEEILDKEYHGFKIRDMVESLNEDEDVDY